MAILKAPDMHCEMCVKRIANALTDAKLDFSISLKDKTVSINGNEAAVRTAISVLDDIGFDTKQA